MEPLTIVAALYVVSLIILLLATDMPMTALIVAILTFGMAGYTYTLLGSTVIPIGLFVAGFVFTLFAAVSIWSHSVRGRSYPGDF